MNTVLGVIFIWICITHIQDTINPNRLNRSRVRWNSGTLALLTGFIGLAMLGFIGTPA